MNTSDLDVFVTIFESESISGAAKALTLARTTVASRLDRLEADLNVSLFHRTTVRTEPTSAGLEYYRRIRPLLREYEAANAAIAQSDGVPRGLLSVVAQPEGNIAGVVARILSEYQRRYDQVRVRFCTDSRGVALLEDGVDVAIHYGPLMNLDLVARRVRTFEMIAVAAPSYLDDRGRVTAIEQLADHSCLRVCDVPGVPVDLWPVRGGKPIRASGRFDANSSRLLMRATLDGLGIALLPTAAIESHLASGRLEPVLRGQVGFDIELHLVFPSRSHLSPKTDAFVKLAVPMLRADDWLACW